MAGCGAMGCTCGLVTEGHDARVLSVGGVRSLFQNSLDGSIPTELGALTALKNLSLYENSLDGSIPTELGALAALTIL
ncbi:hypothetical protein CYMTET_12974 [Cymbomonas tetramitiformis]|uniref:Uncharacterized protein n=1 Tax=Cymbomonas tetramitiformis TaxID=36881 RepID=A0AAE0GKM0_9CHLO|nr:hypothetical protein CYMTET_12974 [Cymbomonas tetramitiformis]